MAGQRHHPDALGTFGKRDVRVRLGADRHGQRTSEPGSGCSAATVRRRYTRESIQHRRLHQAAERKLRQCGPQHPEGAIRLQLRFLAVQGLQSPGTPGGAVPRGDVQYLQYAAVWQSRRQSVGAEQLREESRDHQHAGGIRNESTGAVRAAIFILNRRNSARSPERPWLVDLTRWRFSKIPIHEVVLDTNVLVAGLRSKRGASYQVLRSIGQSDWRLNILVALALEYEDVS